MEFGGIRQAQESEADDAASETMEKPDEQHAKRLRSSLSAIDRQYEAQRLVPRRIHIIGTGSIGKLVAHALRGIPNPPPVTLIFHRASLLQAWKKGKKVITLEDGGVQSTQSGYDVELSKWETRQHNVLMDTGALDSYTMSDTTGMKPHEAARMIARERKTRQEQGLIDEEEDTDYVGAPTADDAPIHNLIVSTKTVRTLAALSAVKHRLSKSSTICFLQNGLGVIDEINRELFPDEETRPNYVQGIITHGVNVPPRKLKDDPFYAVHAGHGSISLGLLPRKAPATHPSSSMEHDTDKKGRLSDTQVDEWGPTARYMLRTLTRCPVLCAVGFTPIELLQLQLEKLAVNAILNPLTVLLDNRNGSILYNFALTRTMRLMLAEISLVIRSLPELQGLANLGQRFGPDRLETLVVGVAHDTADNISSMLADVRGGRRTEVEYINGYIVRRGEEIGIKCVVNYAIMQTVIGKCMMVQREVQEEIPLAGRLGSD